MSPTSTSRPNVFFGRLSSLLQRPQPTIGESRELQQTQRQHMTSHPGPRAVEVAPVRDKQVCLLPFLRSLNFDNSVQALYVAPRQEPVSERVKRIKNPTRWTRCVLFICSVSLPSPDTNSHQ